MAATRNSKEAAANNAAAEEKKSKPASEDNASTASESTRGQPLGPPPRPKQNGDQGGDYFNQSHDSNNGSYQAEPNPFDAQFSNNATSAETPGKIGLPSVASLTSPSSLLPNDTPGWNSLRSGPLSPAMLTGPTGTGTDYFDSNFSRGFPTPNESSLRTGLTPGGGGSMFPAPSPNSQNLFNQLQLGVGASTPNTLEFLRTGVAAKAATNGNGPTSQPTENQSNEMDLKLPTSQAPSVSDAYAHPDADAANGLFMLAQSNGTRSGNQFAVPQQPAAQNAAEPSSVNSRAQKSSVTSGTTQVESSDSEESERAKPATRSRGKKAAEPKSNNRRKATDTPTKTPSSKRQKGNSGNDAKLADLDDDDDDEPKDSKKMTDEEKRKNFLERNRVAALKCRQRKKQWLANLQTKVDLYTQENDALTQTVTQLREQIMNLKQLLLSHKDCPVTAQQGVSPQAFATFLSQIDGVVPYGGPVNPVSQGMPMMMSDARQGPPPQVIPRS
jgi:ATF/CREB family transcription factor